MLDSTSAYGNYEKYLVELITPIYNKLGWEENDDDEWLDK
jgi:hypothetical protein